MNDARPAPLRVPVADVSVRSSLAGGGRRNREALGPNMAVVQRAVRIISDAPPPPVNPQVAVPAKPNGQYHYHGSDLAAAAPLELDEEEALRSDSGFVDEREEDEEDAADLLEVSLPPPAPPEALRRTSSNPAAARVRAYESEPLIEHELEFDVEAHGFSEREQRAEARPVHYDARPPRSRTPAPSRPSTVGSRADEPRASAPGSRVEEPRASAPGSRADEPRASAAEPPELSALVRAARVQELRPTKPRTHAWWEVFFDDDYLRTVRPPSRQQIARQCDFIESRLGLKPGATLLDVACGLGQHVVELAARGVAAVGIDLSLAMLSRASEEAQQRGLKINFLHADMRDLAFDGNFDAVTCLGTSLGYFDDEMNKKVMDRLLRALKPGGVLLMDVVNRDYVIRSQPNLIWFEGDGCVCMEESEFNYFTSRLHVKRTVILDSGRQLEHEYSLRLYSLHELGQLMNSSGFRVSEVSGRDALPGVFFGHESPNLMIVAQRREG